MSCLRHGRVVAPWIQRTEPCSQHPGWIRAAPLWNWVSVAVIQEHIQGLWMTMVSRIGSAQMTHFGEVAPHVAGPKMVSVRTCLVAVAATRVMREHRLLIVVRVKNLLLACAMGGARIVVSVSWKVLGSKNRFAFARAAKRRDCSPPQIQDPRRALEGIRNVCTDHDRKFAMPLLTSESLANRPPIASWFPQQTVFNKYHNTPRKRNSTVSTPTHGLNRSHRGSIADRRASGLFLAAQVGQTCLSDVLPYQVRFATGVHQGSSIVVSS